MRRIAAELSHETAFALPLPDGRRRLGTALVHSRRREQRVRSRHPGHRPCPAHRPRRAADRPLRAASFGILDRPHRHDGAITLDFPAAFPAKAPAPDGLAQALGAKLGAAYSTGALGDLLAVAGNEAAVRGLRPDFTALARLTRRNGISGIIVTAAAADPHSGYDFVSRYFAPADGIPEDPVTGSAHTALAPYWSHRLGRDSLTGLQASDRTDLVHTAVHGDRVHLTGHAVTVLDGTLDHHAG